jgi:hypothetical protein
MARPGRIVIGFGCSAVLALAAFYAVHRSENFEHALPAEYSDETFWSLVSSFSEAGGYFRSDNLISNEATFQWVVPHLTKTLKRGGVYLGVGPDQNFTYIAAVQPAVAFIVDIRRQNLLLHLMYKAIFESSADRVQFLSQLFGRRPPPQIQPGSDLASLLAAFSDEPFDSAFAKETFGQMISRLRDRHHFALTADDVKTLDYVYNAFVTSGPEIRYSFPNQYGWRRFPSYSQLMLETDADGDEHSYIASEDNFQIVKRLESQNRIIPIVGDFAGNKALRSIGKYLRGRQADVTVFYTSNVEFYLFQNDDWKKFYRNVAELPVVPESVFVRAYFNNYGLRYSTPSSARSVTLIDGIQNLVDGFKAGEIRSYFEVVRRSTAP